MPTLNCQPQNFKTRINAIADSHKLFITSANLTKYAFTLNMKMGVLIQNRHLANQVKRQIKDLIEHDILTLI